MNILQQPSDTIHEPLSTMLKRFVIVIIFGIAFGYIEAAVVVYLREIFHPNGFNFPLTDFGTILQRKTILLTEIGREAATIVLILTGSWLFGKNLRQRFAYFLTIFAVWDIFYYIWLKVLIGWPVTIMDWDILFLIPLSWASPVLYPVIISIMMLVFAMMILYGDSRGKPVKTTFFDWLAFLSAGIIVVVSFCIPGLHIRQDDFDSYFYKPLFAAGCLIAAATFLKCLIRSKRVI
jgi:hypothetical protein